MVSARAAFAITLLAPAGAAIADPTRCSSTEVDLAAAGTDLIELAGDTGWFPSGSAAQLRLTGRVSSHTRVELGLSPSLCWDAGAPGQITATLPMRAGTGVLDVAYGAQLHLFVHIDTTILGHHYLWESEVPIPFIPEDLMVADTTMFDPSFTGTAEVHDTTDPVQIIGTNLLSSIISIIGISGNLHVDVTGAMTTTYRTTTLVSDDGEIGSASGAFDLDRPGAGWGGTVDIPIEARGVVHYAPSLIFDVGADIRILGIRVVEYTLFSIPMDLPGFDREIALTGAAAQLGLPELAGLGDGARVDFVDGDTQELAVGNHGQMPLSIEVASGPAGITLAPLVIAPGAEATLRITASEGALATGVTAPLVLATNDPDHPTLEIAVGIEVGGDDQGDDGNGGVSAGCNAGGPGGGGMILLALLALRRKVYRRPR